MIVGMILRSEDRNAVTMRRKLPFEEKNDLGVDVCFRGHAGVRRIFGNFLLRTPTRYYYHSFLSYEKLKELLGKQSSKNREVNTVPKKTQA